MWHYNSKKSFGALVLQIPSGDKLGQGMPSYLGDVWLGRK